MNALPRLTDADLDRLDALLSTPEMENSMTLDAIQGLLCAVASAPQPVPPEKWIPVVLGEGKFASEDDAREAEALLLRFHADTFRQLAGEDGIEMLSYPVEEGEEELAFWCDGYLEGTRLAEPGWFECGEDEEIVSELLYPFMLLSGRLNILALGDDVAAGLGVVTDRTRLAILAVVGILTAMAVATAGLVSFVGLVCPHLARYTVGGDNRALIPVSALYGALLVSLADLIARLVISPSEVPMGIITAGVGAPFLLYLVRFRE